MTETDYERARATAERELSKLLEERDEIERRILALRQTLSGLAMLAGDETQTGPSRTGSVTGEIRTILRTATEPMTVRHVRNTLVALGYDVGDERSSMAKVQTMLSRMVVSGEAIEKETKDGKAYIWVRDYAGNDLNVMGKRLKESMARAKKR
jgi:hypothetical protein